MRLFCLRLSISALFLLFFPWQSLAIIPPKSGRFPKGFWKPILQDTSLIKYGDPGWVKKMNQRRLLIAKMARGEAVLQALHSDKFILPVLLGKYSDKSSTFSANDFQNHLFGHTNPTGSLQEYFDEVSYGQFQLTGTVYGWFTVDNPQSYYASDNHGMNSNFPQNNGGFVRDVVAKADPTVDFSQFDNDGPDGIPNSGDDDGYVDGVYVVYAGKGSDNLSYGDSANLWPCASALGDNEFLTNDNSAKGGKIKVNAWAIASEVLNRDGNSSEIRTIGVFAHEFGHVLGLPDLYDRTGDNDPPDYNGSSGLGKWCLMSSGAWGGEKGWGESPSNLSAWCKVQLGWVTPVEVLKNGSIFINQAETYSQVYKIWEDGYQFSRYFLIENRQRWGFDKYLKGSGLLIYHVDENRRGPNNDDETHKLVDLEEADGKDDLDKSNNDGDEGDPFPGSSNNTLFNDESYPNSRDYEGQITGVCINNISESRSNITANVTVRNQIGYVLKYCESWACGYGYGSKEPSDFWGGMLFTAIKPGILVGIDFYFRENDTNYELKVYKHFSGSSPSDLLATERGHVENSGWYTTQITSKVVLEANQDFFISFKIENKSYGLSWDVFGPKVGRTYFSWDGISFSKWIFEGSNGDALNIRARIQTKPEIALSSPLVSFGDVVIKTNCRDTLIINNTGYSDLEINSITCDNKIFYVEPSIALVGPGRKKTISITFNPESSSNYAGVLNIESNDRTVRIPVLGSGVKTPSTSIIEEFDNNNNGWEINYETTKGTINNGKYTLEYHKPGTALFVYPLNIAVDNYTIEADIKHLSEIGSCGLIFGADDNQLFALTLEQFYKQKYGLYKLNRITHEWEYPIGGKKYSSYINVDSYNNLKAVCFRDSIKILINGYQVNSVGNSDSKIGKAGFYIEDSVKFECERLKIYLRQEEEKNDSTKFKFIAIPDSLVPDTTNKVVIVADVFDSDLIKKVYLIRYKTQLVQGTDHKFSLAETTDTLTVDSTVVSTSPKPDSLRFTGSIPVSKIGYEVKYAVKLMDNNNYTSMSTIKKYIVAPLRGKQKLGKEPVNVADLMRAVYLALGAAKPTIIDYFGLDLDQSGDFDTPDLTKLLALWRGSSNLLAGSSVEGKRTAKAWLSYKEFEKTNATLSINLENSGSLNLGIFKIKYDPAKFVLGKAVATKRLGEGMELLFHNNEAEGIYVVVIININGRPIPSGSGAILSIPVTNLGWNLDGNGEIALLRACFEDGVQSEMNSEVLSFNKSLPKAFSLKQNYPNPFNPSTTISYTIPAGKMVEVHLSVYNLRGQLVRVLMNDLQMAGIYSIYWDGADDLGRQLPSGIYIYRMQAGDFMKIRKMVLLK